MTSFGNVTFGQQAAHNPNKDVEVPSAPADGISSLAFSPNSNLLVATSWNNQVLCWDVAGNGQATPKAAITLDKPVLCSAWAPDGTAVFVGARARVGGEGSGGCGAGACGALAWHTGCLPAWQWVCGAAGAARCRGVRAGDRAAHVLATPPHTSALPACLHHQSGGCDHGVKMWNLSTNQQQQVAAHAAPVRHAFYMPRHSMLVTGSWDKTLKYWDLRTANPVHTQPLPERVYAMDVVDDLLVVGTADRTIQVGVSTVLLHARTPARTHARMRPPAADMRAHTRTHSQVFNLANPSTPYKSLQSPLKYATRCIAAFPDKQGYLVGSVEGRVAVHHVEDANQGKNFTFKCHRRDLFHRRLFCCRVPAPECASACQ